MTERIPPVPLAERITALKTAYEAGDLNWGDFTRQGIFLAAERFDEARVVNGQDPIHTHLLAEMFESEEAKRARDIGYSGLPALPDGFGHERANDFDTIKHAITQQFGPGYVPRFLMWEMFYDEDMTHHKKSRPDVVLRVYRSESEVSEPILSDPYFALFMLDLLAWKSVRHVHNQFQKNIDMSIVSHVEPGDEEMMWRDKVKKFQQYSAFATKAFSAIHAKAEKLWGEKGHAALDAYRAMTFLKKGAFQNPGKGPGVHRIEVMKLLAAGAVDDANARVSELVNKHPEYFSTRTQKMYLIDTSL